MQTAYLGVDVGGTKTEIVLLELDSPESFASRRIIGRTRGPTHRSGGPESFFNGLCSLAEDLLSQHSWSLGALSGIGVGLPGSIHPVQEVMTQGSLAFLKGFPLAKGIRDRLNYTGPLAFENDANCFTLAEAHLGAGNKWAKSEGVVLKDFCMLGVTLGTGVGGGMFMNGRLIQGRRGGAGEVGHMTLRDHPQVCYCGKSGCAEQFLSGPGLEHAYRERAAQVERLPGKQIFERAREGDPFAQASLEAYRDSLVQFLSNLSNLLDPHVIVLGGGISLEPEIYQGIETRLSEGCFLTEDPPRVLKNLLGDAAGAEGAALLIHTRRMGRQDGP